MNNIIAKEEKNLIKEGCKNVESYLGYYSDENEIKISATKMIGSNERTMSYFVNSILLNLAHIRNILESKISNTIGNTQNNLETSKISKR